MRYLTMFALLLFAACTSDSPTKMAHDCSSMYEEEERVVIENAYFKILDDESLLAVKERKILGDTIGQTVFNFSPATANSIAESWSIAFTGDNYSLAKKMLIADISTRESDASYVGYSLATGEVLLEYTYDKFEVLFGDEFNKRYLGFYSNKGRETAFSEVNRTKNTIGFLTYASQKEKLNALRIEAADPFWLDVLDISNPVVELIPVKENSIQLNAGKTLYFTNHEGENSAGVDFDMKLMFYTTDTYKPVEFILQVRNDKLLVPEDFSHSVFLLESL